MNSLPNNTNLSFYLKNYNFVGLLFTVLKSFVTYNYNIVNN